VAHQLTLQFCLRNGRRSSSDLHKPVVPLIPSP
jgi:hypothetical protein